MKNRGIYKFTVLQNYFSGLMEVQIHSIQNHINSKYCNFIKHLKPFSKQNRSSPVLSSLYNITKFYLD